MKQSAPAEDVVVYEWEVRPATGKCVKVRGIGVTVSSSDIGEVLFVLDVDGSPVLAAPTEGLYYVRRLRAVSKISPAKLVSFPSNKKGPTS